MNNGNPAYVTTADSESFKYKSSFLKPVQHGLFLGCSWMDGGGGKKALRPENLSHLPYNVETWWQLYLT